MATVEGFITSNCPGESVNNISRIEYLTVTPHNDYELSTLYLTQTDSSHKRVESAFVFDL